MSNRLHPRVRKESVEQRTTGGNNATKFGQVVSGR